MDESLPSLGKPRIPKRLARFMAIARETSHAQQHGKDEASNNMHDPTMRDRNLDRDVQPDRGHGTKTSEMGSRARAKGQQGHGLHR
jgi:hypothetical protein